MGGSTTTTMLVNKTDKEISFYVESSGDNYRFKKTLKAGETSKEEFDPNSTFSTLRMFHNKAPTDISVSTDDMIESRVITITEPEPGRFLLTAAAQLVCNRELGADQGKLKPKMPEVQSQFGTSLVGYHLEELVKNVNSEEEAVGAPLPF